MKTTRSKDGTTLAYDVYGSGPALIYCTGATCFRSFEPVVYDAEVLGREFSVYNYDRRGRGDSGDTLPYSMQREVEDIEAMIDAAGGTAYLYGHSSGAILAIEAAMHLGDKVQKLVIYDAAYAGDEADQQEFAELGQALDRLLEKGKHGEALTLFLQGIGMPQEMIEGMPHSPQWPTLLALAPTLAYDTQIAADLPPVARAAQLKTPTLILVGEVSPPSMHQVAARLRESMPEAETMEFAGQDHVPDAEMLLAVIAKFLKA